MKKILLIGETCKDIFEYGNCKRLSPEAPVPVFLSSYKIENEGMAGNVMANLESLGLEVYFITNPEMVVKRRYIEEESNNHLLRIDEDPKIKRIKIPEIDFLKYDALVISDYNKGFLSKKDISDLISKHPLSFLDSKKPLGKWCKGASFIKINEKEYSMVKGRKVEKFLNLIVTLGGKGCIYHGQRFPVQKVQVRDVSGAGDTFLASFVKSYLENKNIAKSLNYANTCARLVVSKRGVSTINSSEVQLE